MKYLLLITLSTAFIMCSDREAGATREIVYRASPEIADVTYCDEHGNFITKRGVKSFEKTIRVPGNTIVCLTVRKRDQSSQSKARAEIFMDGYLIYHDSDENKASVGGIIPKMSTTENLNEFRR